MKSNAAEHSRVREFLLGQMPSEDREQFEERLFTDNELYEELSIVEDELVDEYLRHQLSPQDCEHFEGHFLISTEHQEKLRFARTFRKYLDAEQSEKVEAARPSPVPSRESSESLWTRIFPGRSPAFGYAMAAALILVVAGVSWVVWKNFISKPRDPGRVWAVALTPGGLTRGGNDVRRLLVPADTDTIRFRLLLPEDRYESYEATLIDAGGQTLTMSQNLKREVVDSQASVVFDAATNLVPPGDYQVRLNGMSREGGTERVTSYSFLIDK